MNLSILKKPVYGIIDFITLKKGFARKINGMKFRFPVKWFRYFPNDYEKENCDFLKKTVKPGMDIIDIGAHIGFFGIVFSQLTNNKGRVFSLEPTPGTYKLLLHNLKINHCENVTPVQAAVSNKVGKATFYISEDYEGNNSNSLVKTNPLLEMTGYEVQLETIDNIVKTYSLTPSIIKIDVEGAEFDTLTGGLATFSQFKPSLILGLHPAAIIRKGDSLKAIWDLLISAGYQVKENERILTQDDFCGRELLFDVNCIIKS
jgi:FkbM family methyltransferase